MANTWIPYVVASAFAITTIGLIIWRQKKNFLRVGKVTKLYFFPVKSLRGIEVHAGRFTSLGFEVKGILDRTFMLIDSQNILVSQRQCPSMIFLVPEIHDNFLLIRGPDLEPLRVDVLKSPPPKAKVIECKVHTDIVGGIDCGEVAALWFQNYLKRSDVRLVQFFPSLNIRSYTRNDPFYMKLKKKYVVGFQDIASCHMLSQPSIDDLNSRIEQDKISVHNFRPNVLIDECGPYDEDSWKYIKIGNKTQLERLILITRCLMTTNNPETGVLSNKEPLVTLRKYRIPSDPCLLKILGSIPCLGVGCAVLKSGVVKVGDDVFAIIDRKPDMQDKTV